MPSLPSEKKSLKLSCRGSPLMTSSLVFAEELFISGSFSFPFLYNIIKTKQLFYRHNRNHRQLKEKYQNG